MVYLTKDERSQIGASLAAYIQRKKFTKIVKLEIKRRDISKEIWSTEKYYNEQLCTVIELFFKPLMEISKKPIEQWTIKEADIHSIFSHIENIYGLSNILFEKIDPRLQNYSPSQGMGDIFCSLSPFFKCYKQYSENYSNSIETLKNVRANSPQLNNWLKAREKDIRCKSLDLPSLLIAPIQRVPRYILLLEALYNATQPTHHDKEKCLLAANQLKNVAQVVNDGISEDQNRKKLIQLQSIFDHHMKFLGPLSYPNLVEAHRKLIKEGKLLKKSLRDNGLQSRMVYLCNDILITVSSISLPIGQHGAISKVDKIIPLVSAMTIFNSDDNTSFYLVSPIKTHLFVCESQQVRSQWLSEIQNAIVLLIESSPKIKAQRSEWTLEYDQGKWKAVSSQPINENINVQSSFETLSINSKKNKNHSNNDLNSNNNNNDETIHPNLLSKSPDNFKYGSIEEWRHGVPKVSTSKISNSFLRSSSSNSPFTSQTNLIGNHTLSNNNSNETNSESESEEYAL
ncbi:hypothetical protein DICPUDRAFT_89777 [Dictyostelium purpureum]|uniref:DH domain-containing protein n=1 Tax=Dictyostelium purpureum TaxID=5786 RepID=F0ZY48_DICPU|nr:uncharacterized protein DICPUDRAFT_89777 [Dictyostelium purpureum]EGC31122.1 hypothetical protein DICPUDRAFT_89777 [Dictyostelium purpureum]|eukprot:XP_003292340.1 hypothetical protein DICPUDRAFT_89777 [Dictyostelium purpureum]